MKLVRKYLRLSTNIALQHIPNTLPSFPIGDLRDKKLMQEQILSWLDTYSFNLTLTSIVMGFYFLFRVLIAPVVRRHARKGKLKQEVVGKALSTVNILLGIGAFSVTLIVWGFDFRGLLTLSASLLAVTGVAMFAAWSVLSNITAFFILLAHSSFKRGSFVRVIDADNYIEGYISEINLFNTKLISDSREVVIYPNNLLLSRPIVLNPRVHLDTYGKFPTNNGSSEDVSGEGSSKAQAKKKNKE
jgi:small-conductance mechanosensitive channel